MKKQLLTPDDVSKELGVTVETLRNWRHQKQGPPHIKIGSRLIRYRTSDFQDWISKRG